MDVLIIMWGTKAKGKIVDGKGNIQSGKKGVLLGSAIVIIANPKPEVCQQHGRKNKFCRHKMTALKYQSKSQYL